MCCTDATWWKNLRGGATVTAVILGRRRHATAQVVSGPAVAEHLARHLCVVRDAKYHGVRLGADGEPDPGDLARAAETTVMIRIRIGDPNGRNEMEDPVSVLGVTRADGRRTDWRR
jgi:hypothetical protein